MSHYILYPPIIIDGGPNAGVYFGGPKSLQWSNKMDEPTTLRTLPGTFTFDWEPTEPYQFSDRAASIVGSELAEQYRRTLGVWRDNDWKCRDQVVKAFDKKARYRAIRAIGVVLEPRMAELMSLPYGQDIEGQPSFNFWTAVTGLPVHCDESAEVVQTDQV